MRNMSFALTTDQVLNRTKTVTRRMGWKTLEPGTLIRAVRKGMGLKKGEKVEELAIIRIVAVEPSRLLSMLDEIEWGIEEVKREGLADHPVVKGNPYTFVDWFAATHKCGVEDPVTRIEFEYV